MKKIIFFLCAIVLYSCNSQSHLMNEKIKKHNMEYFRIEKYKDWKVNTDKSPIKNAKFLKKGNDYVSIHFSVESTFLRISSAVNQYALYKSYFPNKGLKVIGREFYGFSIGEWHIYDENGKLTKQSNKDALYKFSVDQLINKMQKEYSLDINKKNKTTWVDRWASIELNNKPLYSVSYDLKDESHKWKYILVDGTTGETLFTTLFSLGYNETLDPYNKYLVGLRKQEAEDNAYYTTYKGKDYTKKEWKELEEEWYTNHQQNKGKSFWDDIFKRSGKR